MGKMKNKYRGISICLIVCLIFLSGCSGNSKPVVYESTTEISYSWWGNDDRHRYTLQALDIFTEQNQGQIEVQANYGSWGGYENKMHIYMRSHNAPDVMQINYAWLSEYADEENIPYDGAVMAIDDYKIAESMGRTEKFFRHSMAYKYEDELFETLLTDIEWNTSKTGLINPVAIFEPVDLNGAITTRATLHNITYIKDMMLGIGDRIRVYRSNMVIPKIHDSIDKSGNFSIPDKCPICGQPTRIVKENDSEVLMCENPNCKGKLLNKLVHAASRNALDIENFSESTIEKFINLGWLNSIKDIYHLSVHENDMKTLEGFGKKSVEKLLNSIEESRKTSLERFLYSLSVPLLGKSASKMIAEAVDYDLGKFMNIMTIYGAKYFGSIQGIGNVLISSMDNYFEKQCDKIWQLSKEFVFETKGDYKTNDLLNGKTFVITGSLNHYSNRNELKEVIESNGGKVSGSISSKTSYLINNDIDSTSSKNKKAKSLGIPIINEEDFANMLKK